MSRRTVWMLAIQTVAAVATVTLALDMYAHKRVEAFGGVATGFARGAPALVLVGPNLMLAAAGAAVAAAVDLAWLGTLSALACADAR